MKVEDPRGQTWRVHHRWVPWQRRFRTKDHLGALPDIPDIGGGDDPITGIIGGIILVIFLPVILVGLVILGIAALELLVLLAVLPFAALGRIAFGRHWTVVVRRDRAPWWETDAGGWGSSRRRMRELADDARRGDTPRKTLGQ